MADGVEAAATPVKVKEIGATTVGCPMLNSTNYTVWSLRMKVVLRIHKAWSVIDPGTEKNEERDYLAMGLLYQAIPESLIMQIGDVESSKILWDAIKTRHIGADRVKEARLQTLNADFDRLKMNETESINSFAGILSGIASKSASLGETFVESKMVKKLLKSVPRRFIHLVASLEQVLDLKTVGYEDVVGRLKAYEERVKEADDVEETKVLFSKSNGGGGATNGRCEGSYGSGSKNWGRNKKGEGFNGGSGGSGSRSGSNGNRPKQAQGNKSHNSNQPNNNSNQPSFNSDPKKKRPIQNYLLSM